MTEEKCNHIFSYWGYDGDGADVELYSEDVATIRECEKCGFGERKNLLTNKWE